MDIIPQFPTLDSPDPEVARYGRREYLTDADVLQAFLELAVARTGSEIGYLHLFDEDAQEIKLNVWSSKVFDHCTTSHDTHYPLKDAGIWADSIRTRKTVTHNDYLHDPGAKGLPEGHMPLVRHMSASAEEGGKILGIVGVGNKPADYSDTDRQLLEQLIEVGWPVVENRLAERRSREAIRHRIYESQDTQEVMFSLIHAVGRAVELRDRYTSRHQSNVAYISDAIGVELDMSDEQRFGLRLGASIHDIGKIGIPADILNTPRKLTPAELAIIQTHPVTGAAIFSTVKVPWPLGDMIRQHHERMDGSGYPDGLIRDQICLEARIIGVADTFDAVASHRPYREAMGKDAAMAALLAGRGEKYDPYVVDALGRIVDTDPLLKGNSMYRS